MYCQLGQFLKMNEQVCTLDSENTKFPCVNPDLSCGFPLMAGSSVEQAWREGSVNVAQGSLKARRAWWLKSGAVR